MAIVVHVTNQAKILLTTQEVSSYCLESLLGNGVSRQSLYGPK